MMPYIQGIYLQPKIDQMAVKQFAVNQGWLRYNEPLSQDLASRSLSATIAVSSEAATAGSSVNVLLESAAVSYNQDEVTSASTEAIINSPNTNLYIPNASQGVSPGGP